MIGFRCWGVRQVQVGVQARPAMGHTAARWLAEATWTTPEPSWDLPPFEIERVPVYEPRLVGMAGSNAEQTWEPGWSRARCWYAHQAPSLHPGGDASGCGFHALADLQRVSPTAVTGSDTPAGKGCWCMVVGLAALAGDVIEGRYSDVPVGWRGAEARVLALLDLDNGWTSGRAQHYCCDSCARLAAEQQPVFECSPASHTDQLAEVYRVPVFSHPADLERYAMRCRAGLPQTWASVKVNQPDPPPFTGRGLMTYQNIQQAAADALAAQAAALRQLPRLPKAAQAQAGQPYNWGGAVPSPGWVQGPTRTSHSAWVRGQPDPAPPNRKPPARRPPWWGQGTPPTGTGPNQQPR